MRPLAHALPGALAELLKPQPLSAGKVAFAWRAAVGAAVERVSAVRLDGKVLVVETTSAEWAIELTRSSDLILTRLKTLLGDAVERIVVRQP